MEESGGLPDGPSIHVGWLAGTLLAIVLALIAGWAYSMKERDDKADARAALLERQQAIDESRMTRLEAIVEQAMQNLCVVPRR